jgi:hypothetical protein
LSAGDKHLLFAIYNALLFKNIWQYLKFIRTEILCLDYK